MDSKTKLTLKGKSLLKRLTGIAFPFGGLNWTPGVDEQDKARRLLTFLSDRRSLYAPFDCEIQIFVTQSVLEIRKRVVADLEDVKTKSVLGQSLSAISAACRKFLSDTQAESSNLHHYHHSHDEGFEFYRSLGEFRAFIGIQVAVLAYAYDLKVEGELTTILPPIAGSKTIGKEKVTGGF